MLILVSCTLFGCRKDAAAPACVDQPGQQWVKSGGCGQVFLYGMLDDSTAITMWIDDAWYASLEEGCHSYGVTHHGGLRVEAVRVSPHADSTYFNYCNDVAFPNEGVHYVFPAQQGQAFFLRSTDANTEGNPYQIDVQLEGLEFQLPEGRLQPARLVWKQIWVGWFPG